jgi:RHH-type proline utilization regulon transcriptional repressor/proline dehydrogenase/delta 1-pyrroline-5-carboxylate dehydrogenase
MATQDRTLEIAEELFGKVKGTVPGFFRSSRWKGRIMDWAMKDEPFKVQLFRFVDAIPSLKTEAELLELFSEYFYGQSPLLPTALKRWIPHKGIPALIAGKLIKANVTSLAKQFIAGTTPEEVLPELTRIRGARRCFTIDLLGEAVLSESEAGLFLERYLVLIDALKGLVDGFETDELLDTDHEGPIPRGDVSLKVSSFYSHLDPISHLDSVKRIKVPLKRVMEKAAACALSVTFDMEHYGLKDLTFEIFKSTLDDLPEFQFPSIAVQAYLTDSEADLRELIRWARAAKRRVGVRLVKGAYWDYEKIINTQQRWPVPVFTEKGATDFNFEKLTRLILENTDAVRPAVASHNIRSIAHAMAVAEELGLPGNALEFQTLFGMAGPIKEAVTALGFRVRDYVPVGEFLPGMAYLVRRLLENTSNESFLKLSFVDKLDFDELMSPPQEEGAGISPDKNTEDKEEEVPEHNEPEEFVNTPLTDFSRAELRDPFALGVEEAKTVEAQKIPLVIGGLEVFTEATTPSIDPSDPRRVLAQVSNATIGDVGRAVESAREVFKGWSATSAEERAGYLIKAAEWISENSIEIAAAQVFEVGKSWREADGDVAEAIDFLNFYAGEMIRIGAPRVLGTLPGELNYSHYVARGVVAVISPWNFPLAIATGMVSAALVTGNAVILKPSSLSPLTAYYIIKAFAGAGLPDGVLQFLPGPGSVVGSALTGHPDVDAVAFTGSMEVGLEIIKRAGVTAPGQLNVKKVIAEMGGKNAIIVDSSADLDEAIKGVIASFTGFQGQKCSACSRVIVVGGIKEDFCSRLAEAVSDLSIGPPEDPANIIGPVIDEAALKRINDYIEIGKSEATLYYRHKSVPEDGYFVGPAIFTDVGPEARIARDEIFGPVLAVMEAADIDSAIEIANSTPFALTGGIYSRSPLNIDKVRRDFRVGNLYINRKITGALVGHQPFGGFKMSGLGSKAGGVEYLQNFLFPRSVSENTLRRGFAPPQRGV